MKLLDAECSAQAHANVLKVIKKELDHIKLVKTMSTNPMDLTEHYKVAKWVWELHNESQQWLQDLTTDIGLSGSLSLPILLQLTRNTSRNTSLHGSENMASLFTLPNTKMK